MSSHKKSETSELTSQNAAEAEVANVADDGVKDKPRPQPNATLAADLVHRIAESLKDVDSDDDEDDDDLENDADLLEELQHITDGDIEEELPEDSVATEATTTKINGETQTFLPTTTTDTMSIIQQRIKMYKQARAQAKASGESAKARRFGRGLKTLMDLLKQAKAGETINMDDIPPKVSVKPAEEGSSVETPTLAASEKSAKQTDPLIEQIRKRQDDYKAAALQAESNGDIAASAQFHKVVKQFDSVIKMCENGQEVDLSDMPPSPEKFQEFLAKMQATGKMTI